MSVKTSFDIPRKSAAKAAVHSPKRPKKRKAVREPKVRTRRSLRERREAARNGMSMMILVIVLLVLAGVVYFLWQPVVRITQVEEAAGISDASLVAAEDALKGTYYGILPRDSIFFYPEREVRAAALEAAPALMALSVSRSSFHSLKLSGIGRSTAFYWCGESAADFSVALGTCYSADNEGFIFAKAPETDATSTPMLRIYGKLDVASSTGTYPLKGRVIATGSLPNLLRFIKAVQTLGVPVLSTAIQNDEATLFVTPKTRIIYVLGREEAAALLAKAAFPQLNLLDGSIEYVDLRFDGKVAVKRYQD